MIYGDGLVGHQLPFDVTQIGDVRDEVNVVFRGALQIVFPVLRNKWKRLRCDRKMIFGFSDFRILAYLFPKKFLDCSTPEVLEALRASEGFSISTSDLSSLVDKE